MIPDLEVRTITVNTTWPGATPQDVEKEILIQQEDYLGPLSGLKRMVSTASMGAARIRLEFPFGTDINEALIKVNNALTQVPSYPENVNQPRIYASSFSSNAFMFFRIQPMPGYPVELDMVRMGDYIQDNVRPRMERIPGVASVSVVGGAPRQIQIRIDPNKLAAAGITLSEVRATIRARNRDFSAGDLDSGKRSYMLRTIGRFETVGELETVILARRGDSIIRLGDVATVALEIFERRREAYVDGKPTINLFVRKEVGSNVIAIKKAMAPLVEELNREVLAPARVVMTPITDDVRYVQASVANVWRNLAIGSLLATIIMWLFLRSIRATVIGVIGIPVCTVAAFIALFVAGRTVNVISLAGVAFAIGMTLDNSIVVLESIDRFRRDGMERFEAGMAGGARLDPDHHSGLRADPVHQGGSRPAVLGYRDRHFRRDHCVDVCRDHRGSGGGGARAIVTQGQMARPPRLAGDWLSGGGGGVRRLAGRRPVAVGGGRGGDFDRRGLDDRRTNAAGGVFAGRRGSQDLLDDDRARRLQSRRSL
jgi:multidrug efflux pump subunit AcrB